MKIKKLKYSLHHILYSSILDSLNGFLDSFMRMHGMHIKYYFLSQTLIDKILSRNIIYITSYKSILASRAIQ